MLINRRWRRFRRLAKLIPLSIVISVAAFGVSATQFYLDKVRKTRSLLAFTNAQAIELYWKTGSDDLKITSTLKLTLINNGNQPASFAKAHLVLDFPKKGSPPGPCTTAFQNPFQIGMSQPFAAGTAVYIPYDLRPKVVKPGEIEVIEGSASWQPIDIVVDPSQRQQTVACLNVWAIDSVGDAFTFVDKRSIYHWITTGDATGSPGMARIDYKVIDILKAGRRFDAPQ